MKKFLALICSDKNLNRAELAVAAHLLKHFNLKQINVNPHITFYHSGSYLDDYANNDGRWYILFLSLFQKEKSNIIILPPTTRDVEHSH